jgi:hypothetical protein
MRKRLKTPEGIAAYRKRGRITDYPAAKSNLQQPALLRFNRSYARGPIAGVCARSAM